MTLEEWRSLYEKVAALILAARSRVRSAVNQEMVLTYWQVGQLIVEDEQVGEVRAEYGKAVLEGVAERLTAEFGKGFDVRNLRYMRQFYLLFPNWNAVRSELSWTHYRLLLKVESAAARAWYMAEAESEGWSTRALERQINSFYYERIWSSRDVGEGDNPTLGLILCSEKNEAVAKYSVLAEGEQIFASKYRLVLPTEAELVAGLRRLEESVMGVEDV